MKSRRSLLIVLSALAVIATVWSTLWIVAPGQQTLDARVQRVASQLKCLICQGESVADSPSSLAQQMRASIRQQLQSGRSEQEVIQYFERSYGDQILWSPPWQGFSLLAWLVPIVFLLSGIGLIILLLREWHSNAETAERDILGTGLAPVPKAEAHVDQIDHNEPSTPFRTETVEIVPCADPVQGSDPVPTITVPEDNGLERYRAQLEAELAEDDVLFRKSYSTRRATNS